ncbi:MAG: hypothetical protein JXA10_04850 [Anaerolineae bacterium]|nr:hypothetical protein [Anaerolineae bacterium]
MSLVLSKKMAEQLQAIAKREKRSVEDILDSMLKMYNAVSEPLAAMDGMFDDDITDLSTTVRETMREFYRQKK